jgi:hypothetical protein
MIVSVMAVLAAVNMALADRLVVEHGVTEWRQAVFLASAGARCIRLAVPRLEETLEPAASSSAGSPCGSG